MKLLNFADSLIPIKSKMEIAATINMAGRFKIPERCGKLSVKNTGIRQIFS